MNDDNFNFIGLPSNEPIHVDDKKPNKKNKQLSNKFGFDPSKMMDNIPMDLLKKMLPPEVLNSLQDEANATGKSIDDVIKESVRIEMPDLDDILDEALSSMGFGGMKPSNNKSNTNNEEEDDDNGIYKHELGDDVHLDPTTFGSIPCVRDPNIYEHFVDMYGDDGTTYLNDNGIKNLILTDVTEKLPVEEIDSLVLAEYNDTFILFYAQPKDETKYGFFISVIEMPDGDFALFVPEFCNTFKLLKDGSVTLYDTSLDKDRVFFRGTMSGKQEFIPFTMSGLELSTMFQLAPQNKCLLTPHQFGTIKNVMAPVMNNSEYLKIGTITSNESPASILLKKDAELPLDQTKFPLYIKFDHVVSQTALLALSSKLFKVDFNESQLLDNCELKYNSSHELYIEVDLGNI